MKRLSEQVTKEQLLDKAKRFYPTGTKMKNMWENSITKITKNDFFFSSGGDLWAYGSPINVKIYDEVLGWIEPISKPYEYEIKSEILSATPKVHDGYIVPFDVVSLCAKKGDIAFISEDKKYLEMQYGKMKLPIEIAEQYGWEKHYPEQFVNKTAVEWLHEIAKQREPDKFDWQQAKEMEKEQMINAIDYCRDKYIDSENYYNRKL